ncbi:hypothetical protein CEXT_215661 [Caerostris extrusa]|uniref:Pectate lyase n=1 Tax=Caerostris extrusa TaxID=172846 RepID=A0AAV4UN40_CAEEX|nr:hypothetical protein CEXT_215661 [Caerostris extrusa]
MTTGSPISPFTMAGGRANVVYIKEETITIYSSRDTSFCSAENIELDTTGMDHVRFGSTWNTSGQRCIRKTSCD